MKATENRRADDAVTVRDPMLRQHRSDNSPLGNTRPEAGVRTPAVVMRHPLAKDPSDVILVQRHDPVPAFAPNRTNQALAKRIGLWHPHWRLQNGQPHRRDRAIHRRGVDAVMVMLLPSTRPSDVQSHSSAGCRVPTSITTKK